MYLLDNKKVRDIKDTSSIVYHKKCHTTKKFKKHERKLKKEQKHSEILQKAITYLSNHYHQMNYAGYLKQGYLIGSGVTESACKTLIKSRFCGYGMQWEEANTRLLTLMRGLVLTPHRWNQAWKHLAKSAA